MYTKNIWIIGGKYCLGFVDKLYKKVSPILLTNIKAMGNKLYLYRYGEKVTRVSNTIYD